MGTSQLMSVPYALYAKTAESVTNDAVNDADADPNNELQAVSFSNDTLYLSSGGQVYLGAYGVDLVNDADADPTNELNTAVVLNGTDLETTDSGGTIITDLSSLQDGVNDADADPNNELQTVSFSSDTLYLSSGGQVYLGTYGIDFVDDADADAMNEIQDLQLSGNGLTITNNGTATSIDLSGYLDNTDTQLDETAVDVFVSNNGYITSPDDADADSTNEIQTIPRTGTTVALSNGGGTFEDSVGVYISGTGIDITNNVVSSTEPTYTIGLWPELGGFVFWISADGKHGLVADTQDQDQGGVSWENCQDFISKPSNHSVNGQKFRDWRVPTKYELNELYLQQSVIGGFAPAKYWSSTEINSNQAWSQFFLNGVQNSNYLKSSTFFLRSVRAF
jgi:hypothetical protein